MERYIPGMNSFSSELTQPINISQIVPIDFSQLTSFSNASDASLPSQALTHDVLSTSIKHPGKQSQTQLHGAWQPVVQRPFSQPQRAVSTENGVLLSGMYLQNGFLAIPENIATEDPFEYHLGYQASTPLPDEDSCEIEYLEEQLRKESTRDPIRCPSSSGRLMELSMILHETGIKTSTKQSPEPTSEEAASKCHSKNFKGLDVGIPDSTFKIPKKPPSKPEQPYEPKAHPVTFNGYFHDVPYAHVKVSRKETPGPPKAVVSSPKNVTGTSQMTKKMEGKKPLTSRTSTETINDLEASLDISCFGEPDDYPEDYRVSDLEMMRHERGDQHASIWSRITVEASSVMAAEKQLDEVQEWRDKAMKHRKMGTYYLKKYEQYKKQSTSLKDKLEKEYRFRKYFVSKEKKNREVEAMQRTFRAWDHEVKGLRPHVIRILEQMDVISEFLSRHSNPESVSARKVAKSIFREQEAARTSKAKDSRPSNSASSTGLAHYPVTVLRNPKPRISLCPKGGYPFQSISRPNLPDTTGRNIQQVQSIAKRLYREEQNAISKKYVDMVKDRKNGGKRLLKDSLGRNPKHAAFTAIPVTNNAIKEAYKPQHILPIHRRLPRTKSYKHRSITHGKDLWNSSRKRMVSQMQV